MESNYIKSARAKINKLGIKTYEDYKKNKFEVFDIIWKTFELEYCSKVMDYHTLKTYPLLSYTTLDEASSWLEHQPQPWQVQPLEYYTERSNYETTKQTTTFL